MAVKNPRILAVGSGTKELVFCAFYRSFLIAQEGEQVAFVSHTDGKQIADGVFEIDVGVGENDDTIVVEFVACLAPRGLVCKAVADVAFHEFGVV